MIRTLVVASAALLLLATPAAAQVTAALGPVHPKLKAEAVVTGNLVRIGDLVDNAGLIADVPIFRSPDLGTTGTVSAEAVLEAVRAHALIGLDTGGLSEVAVTRASRTIKPEAIERRIAQALSTKFSLGAPDDISLSFDSDLDRTYISLLERGLKSPTIRTLFAVAKVLEVRPSEVLRRTEDLLAKKRR